MTPLRRSSCSRLAAALGAAWCLASAPVRALDWSAVAEVGVPEIVTRNEDGSARVTKLWVVVVDEQGFVRTGDTRWAENIARDPEVELRVLGERHALRAEPVSDVPLRGRVNAAFREKYGWQDRLVHPLGADDARIFRLDARPAP